METNNMKPASKWKWLLIGAGALVLVLASLVALAPMLVSSLAKGFVEGQIGSAVNGTATIQSLSLSWFGEQRITGLAIQDSQKTTDVRLDAGCGNGLFDLATGSIGELRVQLAGSVKAQMLPDGRTSLENLMPPKSAASKPAAPAKSSGGLDLPFGIALNIGGFDFTLTDAQGTAFALRGLKGSASIGRGKPLAIDLAASTQVRDREGKLAIKGSLDRFIGKDGGLDLAALTGEMDANVSGALIGVVGFSAEMQSASLRVQAPAGQPIGIAVNAAMTVEGSPSQLQVQAQAKRPAAGVTPALWAADPRTWNGSVNAQGLPTAPLQRFVASTPLVLTRDLGPTVSLALQTGTDASMHLSIDTQQVKVTADAVIDLASGAMEGKGITLQATLDPGLMASFNTSVDAPVLLAATVNTLRTPGIAAGGAFDVSAIRLDGNATLQPMHVLGLGPQMVAVGATTLSFSAAPVGTQTDISLKTSLQQAPIESMVRVTGLGPKLAVETAQVQATFAAGPLDVGTVPGLPASAREWIARVQPGATTIRVSMAGGMQKGSAQAQLDMALGSIPLQGSWDADTISLQQVQSTLALQPALVASLSQNALQLSAPASVQLTAGPLQVSRKSVTAGAPELKPVQVSLKVPALAVASVQGVCGVAQVREVQVQGVADPVGATLFDGALTVAAVDAAGVVSAGTVQAKSLDVKGALSLTGANMFNGTITLASAGASAVPSAGLVRMQGISIKGVAGMNGPQLFDGTVAITSVDAPAVPSVGPLNVQSVALQAKVPVDRAAPAEVQVAVNDVACASVPGLSAPVGLRTVKASLKGPLDFGPGATAGFSAEAHDATAKLATITGSYTPVANGWKASVQSDDVDMRRMLTLAGQSQALPEWVGSEGKRTFAANVAGGTGGLAFAVNAALDPIGMQLQGARGNDGTLTISKGTLQAKLPAAVVQSLLKQMNLPVKGCDVMSLAATVNACTLPANAQGTPQVLAQGSNLDVFVRLEPWKVQPENGPALDFGANELKLLSQGGVGTSVLLTGSLSAQGSAPAPMRVSLETKHLLNAQKQLAIGEGSVVAAVNVKDFPTAVADQLAGMDGYLVDMLGPVFTVDLAGKSGNAKEDFFKGTFTSPLVNVQMPVGRLSGGVFSVAPDAPITATLRPDENFRARILRPINPLLADMRTTNGRPIQATVSAARVGIPVDMAQLDANFTVDIGEVEMEKSAQFLGVMDLVKSSQGKTIPGLISPLNGVIAQGVLTYRDFKVQVGRLGNSGWQQTLLSDARIDLRRSPAFAEPITIRYPASSVTNVMASIPGMAKVLGSINNALGKSNDTIQQALQVKVSFTGPLDGSNNLKMDVSPEVDLPKGAGGNILDGVEKGIGGALGDLFGKKK